MSSSQVAQGLPVYAFSASVLRDASDWTTYLKNRIVVSGYNAPAQQPWTPSTVGFRLSFLEGKYTCTSCNSNQFAGVVG